MDKDESVFLFITLQKQYEFSQELIEQIRFEIKKGLSERHVPKFIFKVEEGGIPYTVNGKKVEVLVRKIISGDVDVDDRGNIVGGSAGSAGAISTIVNPGCLGSYMRFRDVEREDRGKNKNRSGDGKAKL